MREIIFRAKSLDAGEWEYGSLVIREQDVHGTPGHFISGFGGRWIAVDPKTIGQFMGVRTIDGVRVYEGDILRFPGDNTADYEAVWDESEGAWAVMYSERIAMGKAGICEFMQLIGNIHDGVKKERRS